MRGIVLHLLKHAWKLPVALFSTLSPQELIDESSGEAGPHGGIAAEV